MTEVMGQTEAGRPAGEGDLMVSVASTAFFPEVAALTNKSPMITQTINTVFYFRFSVFD